jgi:hypothetical protein
MLQVVNVAPSSLSYFVFSYHSSCLLSFLEHYLSLFVACNNRIKMSLINSVRTSASIGNFDVIKDLMLLFSVAHFVLLHD